MARGLLLTLAVWVSGCGVAAEPVPVTQVTVETPVPPAVTAGEPQVIVSLPTDLALARPDVVIKLVFSASMDPAASNHAFSLTAASGEAIGGSLFWDVETWVLAFRPATALPFGDFFILVDERAQSRAGLALPEPFSTSFSVVDPGADKNGGG